LIKQIKQNLHNLNLFLTPVTVPSTETLNHPWTSHLLLLKTPDKQHFKSSRIFIVIYSNTAAWISQLEGCKAWINSQLHMCCMCIAYNDLLPLCFFTFWNKSSKFPLWHILRAGLFINNNQPPPERKRIVVWYSTIANQKKLACCGKFNFRADSINPRYASCFVQSTSYISFYISGLQHLPKRLGWGKCGLIVR